MNAQRIFDEMNRSGGEIAPAYRDYLDWLEHIPAEQLEQKRDEAGALFKRLGITFAVYGEDAGSERLIPFDWGSYDIVDQNSSTNVCKSVRLLPEAVSPAKIFTANMPYCANHLDKLPTPTETFVRNFGPRLHHIALSVKDGERRSKENIDFVVVAIAGQGKGFLLEVVGSRAAGLKQICSAASPIPALIIEYVQCFGDFQGFFTRDNVARLTAAAGVDEAVAKI